MNIEQIAYEQASGEMLDYFSKEQLAAFLHRCLSKLAENEVEPVAVVDDIAMHNDGYRIFNGIGEVDTGQRLYTEAQLLAAQLRTAESCAKVCDSIDASASSNPPMLCAITIRNGEWREYL